MTFDLDRIEALAAVLGQAPHVVEVEIGEGESRLVLRRGSGVTAGAPGPAVAETAAAPAVAESSVPAVPASTFVQATVVGIFHPRKGEPLAAGNRVHAGEVVGRIDTMRIPNDCVSMVDGVVLQVLVAPGAAVEYGQALFEIGPSR